MIKICPCCKNSFETKTKIKIYCSEKCYDKNWSKLYYDRNTEMLRKKRMDYYYKNIEDERKRRMEYYYTHLDKELSEENRTKRRLYKAKYRTIPENKVKLNNYEFNKKKSDIVYRLKNNLRRRLLHAFEKYPNGKKNKADEYGINYKAIIDHLMKTKPLDFDNVKYEIDHIIPLAKFDFNNPNEIKKAFAPENHQWLTREENGKKWCF